MDLPRMLSDLRSERERILLAIRTLEQLETPKKRGRPKKWPSAQSGLPERAMTASASNAEGGL